MSVGGSGWELKFQHYFAYAYWPIYTRPGSKKTTHANSLFVFPVKEWEKVAEALSSSGFGNQDTRSFNRFILGNAFETDVDAAGRIVIPETLKDFARLTSKVVCAGMYSRIEIWDETAWKANLAKVNGEADALAGKLSELGIL